MHTFFKAFSTIGVYASTDVMIMGKCMGQYKVYQNRTVANRDLKFAVNKIYSILITSVKTAYINIKNSPR